MPMFWKVFCLQLQSGWISEGPFYHVTTLRHKPEDHDLNLYRRENQIQTSLFRKAHSQRDLKWVHLMGEWHVLSLLITSELFGRKI
jgi:hypothetical protein